MYSEFCRDCSLSRICKIRPIIELIKLNPTLDSLTMIESNSNFSTCPKWQATLGFSFEGNEMAGQPYNFEDFAEDIMGCCLIEATDPDKNLKLRKLYEEVHLKAPRSPVKKYRKYIEEHFNK